MSVDYRVCTVIDVMRPRYSALASGWDVSRALVTTSLEPGHLVDDLSGLDASNMAPKLAQLLAFFLNKYARLAQQQQQQQQQQRDAGADTPSSVLCAGDIGRVMALLLASCR